MTDRFTATAEAMARATGLPAFPFAVIPHPISNNNDEVLKAKARRRRWTNASRYWREADPAPAQLISPPAPSPTHGP